MSSFGFVVFLVCLVSVRGRNIQPGCETYVPDDCTADTCRPCARGFGATACTKERVTQCVRCVPGVSFSAIENNPDTPCLDVNSIICGEHAYLRRKQLQDQEPRCACHDGYYFPNSRATDCLPLPSTAMPSTSQPTSPASTESINWTPTSQPTSPDSTESPSTHLPTTANHSTSAQLSPSTSSSVHHVQTASSHVTHSGSHPPKRGGSSDTFGTTFYVAVGAGSGALFIVVVTAGLLLVIFKNKRNQGGEMNQDTSPLVDDDEPEDHPSINVVVHQCPAVIWRCLGDLSEVTLNNLAIALNASSHNLQASLSAIAEELDVSVACIQVEIALKRDPGDYLLRTLRKEQPGVTLKHLVSVFTSCGRPEMYWEMMKWAEKAGAVIEPEPSSPSPSG